MNPMREDAVLDVILTNKEEVVGNVKREAALTTLIVRW